MASIITRSTAGVGATVKGAPLTINELDANLVAINGEIFVDDLPDLAPSLMLDFVNTTEVPERVRFTRASTATYFDALGVLRTAPVDAPRLDYNPSTLAAQGLLIEEQRTNLITSSAVLPAGVNVTITADTFIAPDGTTTGDQILDNATLGEHYSDSFFTPVAATNYTFSAFIKNIGASSSGFAWLRLAGDFNAFVCINLSTFTIALNGGTNFVSSSIQAINNGWYKVSVTGLSVGTVSTVARVQVTDAASLTPYSGTGKGFAVWGRQLEVGAFPTSYIPTTTTALTRSADVASVNTLSPWWNASEGTFYVEGSAGSLANSPIFVMPHDGTSNNYLNSPLLTTAGLARLAGVVGGAAWTNVNTANSTTANTTFKSASAFKAGDQAICLNAGTVGTGVNASLPVVTTVKLGDWRTSGNSINGYLRRITYYPRRLSNVQLQNLTV